MIKITYVYKDTNEVESTVDLKYRRYDKTLEKCKKYNADMKNPLYIKSITNLNAKPRHTQFLDYERADKYLVKPHFKPTKDMQIMGGGTVWDNIYLIPLEAEEY
jgi:hypothetical protein|tara:strand:- start:913 stop:1224 length:312 start_codon:yes stop_codon:yes gene_type:complete